MLSISQTFFLSPPSPPSFLCTKSRSSRATRTTRKTRSSRMFSPAPEVSPFLGGMGCQLGAVPCPYRRRSLVKEFKPPFKHMQTLIQSVCICLCRFDSSKLWHSYYPMSFPHTFYTSLGSCGIIMM